MSTMINIGPMIARVTRDMLEAQNAIIDVESVYAKLTELYSDEIFESEGMLAQIAVKQKSGFLAMYDRLKQALVGFAK